jgi:hypothetical protein
MPILQQGLLKYLSLIITMKKKGIGAIEIILLILALIEIMASLYFLFSSIGQSVENAPQP